MEFIILIIGVVVFILLKNSIKDQYEYVINNGEFSIGTVLSYSKGKPVNIALNQPGESPKVKYKYSVNGKNYEYVLSASVMPIPQDVVVGQQYLIKYLKDDPARSIMLFDYPIKEEGDFERYVRAMAK